jgi:hypothetical protein
MGTSFSSLSRESSGPLLVRGFLSQGEIDALNAFVDRGVTLGYLDKGMSRGRWGYESRLTTRVYGDRFVYPDIVHSVSSRITDRLRLHDLKKSVAGGGRDGVVVSCTLPGGDVYAHQDSKEDGGLCDVLRCNILTRAAESGGLLQVGGLPIKLDVGDLHCYLPSDVVHSVSTVEGSISRVLWMFGYQINKSDWELRSQELVEEP